MAALRFADMRFRPTEFLDFTSLTLEEFQILIPAFEAAFQAHMVGWRLDGAPRTARRFTIYQSCREHSILWGSLRRQRDCFIALCGVKAGIVMTEGVLERIVQHRCSHVEEWLHRRPVPAHLLLLVHALGDGLVDRTLHKGGRDRFAIPA